MENEIMYNICRSEMKNSVVSGRGNNSVLGFIKIRKLKATPQFALPPHAGHARPHQQDSRFLQA